MVYAWIYANAKIEGDRKDYFTRVCGSGLEEYRSMLESLSKRFLLANSGYRGEESQNCWFSGFLDEKKRMYFMAIGGEQERILGVPIDGDGFRTQYCVLGYGFTEEDIGLYRQDDAIFEPLKAILREIQRKGEDCDSKTIKMDSFDLEPYVMEGGNETDTDNEANTDNEIDAYNIIKSTTAADENLWKQSIRRPVMVKIVNQGEAKKLLNMFPTGAVTVMEEAKLQYIVKSDSVLEADKEERHREAMERHGIIAPDSSNPIKEESQSISKDAAEESNSPKGTGGENKENKGRRMDSIKNGIFRSLRPYGIRVDKVREELFDGGRNTIEQVREQARKCRDELDSEQVESIEKAVKKLKLPKDFSVQMKYYGYMQLWRYNQSKEYKEEQDIFLMIREWAKLMENEDAALENNAILAQLVREESGGDQ